jgi:hypothetical protein
MKDYSMKPRKPMMAGGMTTSADTAMRPMKQQPMNPKMAQAAMGMMYGGKAKKK